MLFGVLFCVCLIASNIFETKQLSFFGHSQTGGVIVFPISYIINDVVAEVWGFRKARFIIWLGFLMNFFFVAVGALCDWLPGAEYWTNDEGFHQIFGLAPRIAAASFVRILARIFVLPSIRQYGLLTRMHQKPMSTKCFWKCGCSVPNPKDLLRFDTHLGFLFLFRWCT